MLEELNVDIAEGEIIKGIKQLNVGKSGGADHLLNKCFKHGVEVLLPYILKLFNVILELEHFPKKWTDGLIVPLHKKGSINEPENYRGITLLNVFGKLFSRVLNNRLDKWAVEYNVYIEAQSGFRAGMGTVDNIFVLHGVIKHCLSEGKRCMLPLWTLRRPLITLLGKICG